MKTKLLFTLLIISLYSTFINAQQLKEDSLKTAFLNAKEDTIQRKLLEEVGILYKDTTVSSEKIYRLLESLVQKKGNPKLWIMMGMTESKALAQIIEQQCQGKEEDIFVKENV